jgi:hypothetical protein
MSLRVTDFGVSMVAKPIIVVAVRAAAPNRTVAVTVMVRVRAGRVAAVAILVAALSSATRRRPADVVADPDLPVLKEARRKYERLKYSRIQGAQ